MIRRLLLALILVFAAALTTPGLRAAGNLEIIWIDAEGGAATLIVSPEGESLLVDTANRIDDRDAKRIMAAAAHAGITKIDVVLTTHFHGDHMGALDALSKMIPIGMYMDHGESIEISRPNIAAVYKSYEALTAGKRRILKAGDRIPLKGLEIEVVMSGTQPIAKPLPGGGERNPACASFTEAKPDQDPDNDHSVGILVRFGKFEFLDMGDLTWNYEQRLVCPENRLGKVDLYQTTHHGLDRSNSPQFVWAIQPTVAVMNNGPRKGGSPGVFETLRKSPGFQDVWQGHLALIAPLDMNAPADMIANMEPTGECSGDMLKASVDANGRFTMTNFRNGFSKSYESR